MSYYSFKKQQLLEQAKYQYHSGGGKKKELLNIIAKTEVLSENARKRYRNLSEKEKEAKITN